MSGPIVAVDTSEIREGKFEELAEAVAEMATFVDANEPRPIAYQVYFDERGTRMTVIQVHPDSASMEHHMTVAAPIFSGFADLITLSSVDVYGEPSDQLVELLRRKAQMLGTATLTVHELRAGFLRFGAR